MWAAEVGLWPKSLSRPGMGLDPCFRNISHVNINWATKRLIREAVAIFQVRHDVALNV